MSGGCAVGDAKRKKGSQVRGEARTLGLREVICTRAGDDS